MTLITAGIILAALWTIAMGKAAGRPMPPQDTNKKACPEQSRREITP